MSFAVFALGAIGAACGEFSGSDAPTTDDGGPTADGPAADAPTTDAADASTLDASAVDSSVPDTSVGPDPCVTDAGLLYCESFEGATAGCGVAWKPANGSWVLVTGEGHSGTRFCRFCANAPNADVRQQFAFTANPNYVVNAWVRVGAGSTPTDAATPPAASGQIFTFGDASSVANDTQAAQLLPDQWRLLQLTVQATSAANVELLDFFPVPYGGAVGHCVDVDDVTIASH